MMKSAKPCSPVRLNYDALLHLFSPGSAGLLGEI